MDCAALCEYGVVNEDIVSGMMKTGEILERLRGLRVLVVGDICLDRWCTYDPGEALASAETGIPRVAVTRVEVTPGAGGSAAFSFGAPKIM